MNTGNPANRVITVGQELTDTFIGNALTYELAVPSNGLLVTRLSWDPTIPNGAKLMLTIGECDAPQLNTNCHGKLFHGSAPLWSPVIGRMTVAAGQTYRVVVDEGEAPWDYGFNQPFALVASIE